MPLFLCKNVILTQFDTNLTPNPVLCQKIWGDSVSIFINNTLLYTFYSLLTNINLYFNITIEIDRGIST